MFGNLLEGLMGGLGGPGSFFGRLFGQGGETFYDESGLEDILPNPLKISKRGLFPRIGDDIMGASPFSMLGGLGLLSLLGNKGGGGKGKKTSKPRPSDITFDENGGFQPFTPELYTYNPTNNGKDELDDETIENLLRNI